MASFVADLIAHLETKPKFLANEPGLLPPGIGLNINYPPVAPEDVQGVSLNVQGKLFVRGGTPLAIDFVCFACSVIPVGASSPGGIGGAGFDPTPDVPGSDAASFNAGFITIVPIAADYTADKSILKGFKKIIKEFNDEDSDSDSGCSEAQAQSLVGARRLLGGRRLSNDS